MTEPTPIETDHPGRYVLTRPLDGAYVTHGGGIASGPFRRCACRLTGPHRRAAEDGSYREAFNRELAGFGMPHLQAPEPDECPACRGTGYQSTGPHPDHPPLEFPTAREAEAFWAEHRRSLGTGWVWKPLN